MLATCHLKWQAGRSLFCKKMSGHSKWHSIRHKKGANDAARGKVFTRHARLITIAAREGGGDLEMNATLKTAIENAKADNMPNANIERAIKKGTGGDKDCAQLVQMSFEGYGPAGVAVMVDCVSDNKNRTVASVRSIFNKSGGNLGESGSVSWIFQQKGRLEIDCPPAQREELELLAIENGASDIAPSGEGLEIFCEMGDLATLKKALADFSAATIQHAKVEMIPQNTVQISDPAVAKKVLHLMEKLEDDDDVSSVCANFEIDEEILNSLA